MASWANRVVLWEREELTCAQCNRKYYEIDNIGQWNCYEKITRFSPSRTASTTILIRADHRQNAKKEFSVIDNIEIPHRVFHEMLPAPVPESIVKQHIVVPNGRIKTPSKNVVVRRFDEVTENRFRSGTDDGFIQVHSYIEKTSLHPMYKCEPWVYKNFS